MNFEKWLTLVGKSERTANSYSRAISGTISEWANSAGLITRNLSEIENEKQLIRISEGIKKLPIFQDKNTKGKGMYSAALNQYTAYLKDLSNEDVQEDIEEVLSSSKINMTEKSALVSARVGQGKYRRELIDYWGRCALTGYKNIRLLIASHIKPWRESENQERLDPYNGLLLLPNLDKVFDLGFISFSEKGEIIVSNYLEDAEKIGVYRDMNITLNNSHGEYMAYHRDIVFERNV